MRKSKPGHNAGILAMKIETLTNHRCSPRTARAALAFFDARGIRFADEAEAAMRIATFYTAAKKFPRLPEAARRLGVTGPQPGSRAPSAPVDLNDECL